MPLLFVNGLLNHVVKELNVEEALKSSILVVHKATTVPLSWYFLNGLLNHVIKEFNVEEVLKSPIFVVQKAAAPKNGVEFRQGSNDTIRNSLAMSCDVLRGFRIAIPSSMAYSTISSKSSTSKRS